jgi:hypothetical protein
MGGDAMIKFQNRILCTLPVIALVWSVQPAVAQAQFTQQGPKLVGTGAIGNAQQGTSVALSGDGNTAIVGGPFDNNQSPDHPYPSVGAAWVFAKPVVFAGTPGEANCQGQSVSVLARQFGGLNNSAAALGNPSVQALQDAIKAFCQG